jgi:Domain of unknown function (DUF4331)
VKTNPSRSLLALTAAALALFAGRALASSHREAPAISNDPVADNTDVYAWVAPGTHDKLWVIANWIPFEEPSGGPNFHRFSDDVLYEVHIARGDQTLADAVTYQFRFETAPIQHVNPANLTLPPGGGKEFFIQLTGAFNQTYTVTKIVHRRPSWGDHDRDDEEKVIAKGVLVAPPRIGPRTQVVANALGLVPYTSPVYDDAFAATFIHDMGSEGRVFAGPRDDGFYADLGGIFDLANLRPQGVAQDGLAGFNVHSIAIEIPTVLLTADGKPPGSTPGDETTLGVWASASRKKVNILVRDGSSRGDGPWVQVSRLGLPLVNEAIIGYQDKDFYNRTQPWDDVAHFGAYFLNPVIVRDAAAVGIYKALGVDPTPFESNRTDILDVINLKNIPTPNAHHIPLSATGDVLRVDMATDSAFPNGRPLSPGTNHEQANVTEVLLSLLLTKLEIPISNGVEYNDATFLTDFPFLALPWQGFDQGHGKPTP